MRKGKGMARFEDSKSTKRKERGKHIRMNKWERSLFSRNDSRVKIFASSFKFPINAIS